MTTLPRLLLIFVIGLSTLVGARLLPVREAYPGRDAQIAAAERMRRCSADLLRLRETTGNPVDSELDPNRTGLIGPEYADFTTTLGIIEAKRTSTNPAFAALLVRYYMDLGLREGDVIAVGASGSFPALSLAVLCAAETLKLRSLVIYSLGASMYGAGDAQYTLLEMLARLRATGLLTSRVLAVSLGGDDDQAGGLLFPESKAGFLTKARECGLPFINESDVSASEQTRVRLYAASGPVRCFVNVGGASVNTGNKGMTLRLPNGVVLPQDAAALAASGNGLAAHYLREGVPVIHLLDMRHLALKNGIPIDPKPLPPIGEGDVYSKPSDTSLSIVLLITGLLLCFGLLLKSARR